MFKGKWITSNEKENNLHIVFNKLFLLSDFKSARINISADNYYKLFVNKQFVCQGVAPSFSFSYKYNEYDITPFLKSGENEIEILCYYQGLKNRVWISRDYVFGIIADIFVDEKLFLFTDKSWNYKIDKTFIESPTVGYDTAYLENRDMRKGFSPSKPAFEAPCPHTFEDSPFPTLLVYKVKTEPTVKENGVIYDFSQEYAASPVIIAFSESDGKRIIIRCAEELKDNKSLLSDMRCGCNYEEICILKKGENVIEQFDYKGLRYLEIITDGAEIKDAYLNVRHFPFNDDYQKIKSEDASLSDVYNLCKNTVKLGTQEGFIDCPTREKGQYLGDAYISGFAHFYLTKDKTLLKKALFDFSNTVKYGGKFLSVAPSSYEQKIADYDLLFPDMLLKYYTLTGDKDTLKKLSKTCEHIIEEYKAFENETGLLSDVNISWNLVDWPENMRDGYEYNLENKNEYGFHNVINAYYIFALKSCEEIFKILKSEKDFGAKKRVLEFNKTFFNRDSGLYVDCKGGRHSSLHSNILPLAFGLCNEKDSVVNFLLERGMTCSVYMAYFFLKALCLSDKKTEALSFITSDEKNSWRNMIKEGATTTFEAWGKNEKWNTSLFHPWATAPVLILNEYFKELLN